MRRALIIMVLGIMLVSFGCDNNTEKQDRERLNINIKKESLDNRLQENDIVTEEEVELKKVADKYIRAVYDGDKGTLLEITKDEVKSAVVKGELDFFQQHKLIAVDRIIVGEEKSPFERQVIVTVIARQPSETIESTYYEHLDFKKEQEKWYIYKVERDA